jgi:hypothetical protein
MNIRRLIAASGLTLTFIASAAFAGPIDPNCTPDKAAKHVAEKSTTGVGNRCTPAKTAKDTGMDKAGVQQKGPIEKKTSKNDTPVEKAKDTVKK